MKQHTWGIRSGHSHKIVEQIIPYLQEHPANLGKGVDTLLEMTYLHILVREYRCSGGTDTANPAAVV